MADGFVIGVDAGTGGVRCVAVTGGGVVLGATEALLPASVCPREGWVEQDPESWWGGVRGCLRELRKVLSESGHSAANAGAVCVDSTSGTIMLLDSAGRSLGNALMYNDARAAAEAEELNDAGAELTGRMGYRFNSSYGLAKALWLSRHEPKRYQAGRIANAADFLTGRICGEYGHTDYTNALKLGYDLLEDRWPGWMADLNIQDDRLPVVHRTGEVIGSVTHAAAEETGLRAGTPVAAGPTDGVAAFYGSGAVAPGEAATTLGTTLVIKSVSRGILLDPKGRIYCHKHAAERWLPGGASNCGCAYASRFFPDADLDALGREAERFLPCKVLLYPLARQGERFPVVKADAERFVKGEPSSQAEHFAAYLQSVAFVERWAYETVAELGGECGGTVFSAGGGSGSDVWMQLRSDVAGRDTARSASPESAFGSAVLAASHTLFRGIDEAVRGMVHEEKRRLARAERTAAYDELYASFREECRRRGME